MDDTRTQATETVARASSLNALALLAATATAMIAWLHPYGDGETLSPALAVPWIIGQSILFVSLGWLVGRIGNRLHYQWIVAMGTVGILLVPTIVLCDAIVFGWTSERFLSSATLRVVKELRGGLWQHAGAGTIHGATTLLIAWIFVVACLLLIARFAPIRNTLHRESWLFGFALVWFAAATPALIDFDTTLAQMHANSSRHPLCVFRIISHDDVGPDPTAASAASNPRVDDPLRHAISVRAGQQRRLHVIATAEETPPDVLIVVVESLRHEMVCEEVMPSLWEFASRGIHCRQHFSGGNATNHGMFSLMNGLEAVWHDGDVRFTPMMNRLMHEAGYEIGFFAGHDDWRLFRMDGYISREHFDVFRIGKPDGLNSDRVATQRTANFLDRLDSRGGNDSRQPRLAILYLYATHADYQSYSEDQVFQPAADDRFLIPFAPSMRDQVWNRYKNSAHTVDRFLSAIMREDRVLVVTGDHGESFLEDGVCGHGVRISKYQNMTPAVLYRPDGTTLEIEIPTMHADILPTLLSMLQIELSDTKSLDGVALDAPDETLLQTRTFTTRNYLNDDVAVIVPSAKREDRAFAYRGQFSIRKSKAVPLNPINEAGQQIEQNPDQTGMHWNAWLKLRFGSFRSSTLRP